MNEGFEDLIKKALLISKAFYLGDKLLKALYRHYFFFFGGQMLVNQYNVFVG